MNRRGFITGLTGLLCAPAIVRASSLMPVSVPSVEETWVTWMTKPMFGQPELFVRGPGRLISWSFDTGQWTDWSAAPGGH